MAKCNSQCAHVRLRMSLDAPLRHMHFSKAASPATAILSMSDVLITFWFVFNSFHSLIYHQIIIEKKMGQIHSSLFKLF